MKNFISLILVCYANCYSQIPNPDLFQTWYLYQVQSTDMDDTYYVSIIQPQVTPTLTIEEDYDYIGHGACNTFQGNFSFWAPDGLETTEFSNSGQSCIPAVHTLLETSYFEFLMSAGWYNITSEGDVLVLTMSSAIMGQAVFKNFLLGTPRNILNPIEIYPNPSTSIINIKAKQIDITEIKIIDSYGRIVKIFNDNFETLVVSDLSEGMYILNIYSEAGILSKKFIKVNNY